MSFFTCLDLRQTGSFSVTDECESLTMSRSRIFGQSFGELQQLSHVPVDLFWRFATEIGLAGK